MIEASELREGLRRGHPSARAALVQRHQDAVFSYFRFLPMDPSAAEEATIAFFRRLLSQAPPGDRSPSIWLFQQLLQDSSPSRPYPPQSLMEERLRRQPEELRRVLFLREFAGLSSDETAVVLGIAPALVRTRLGRARAELQE